jgi:hypothetical protein
MNASRLTPVLMILLMSGVAAAQPEPQPPPEDPKPAKEPKAGDFNAGGQLRFPNGPDEMGAYATFNWVAFDARATYYLLPTVTIGGDMPLAVKKPETIGGGAVDPRMIGGIKVTLDAKLPKMNVPFAPEGKDTELGLLLSGAYMREGAMLLSEKDFPLFIGDFKPGMAGGLTIKTSLSTLVDFSLVPVFVYQTGTVESINAVQIPMSTALKVGSLLKLSVDLGVYTGDDFKFGGSSGGRIALGAALDVKVGPIVAHAGTGFASLLVGDETAYPTVGDSLYIDLNAKYVK